MPRGRFSIGGIKDLRAFFIRMSTLVRDDEVRCNVQLCHNYRRRHYIYYVVYSCVQLRTVVHG